MNCQESEELIYTFREIGEDQQRELKLHIASCNNCGKLFKEVNEFFVVLDKVSAQPSIVHPTKLVNKVMGDIQSQPERKNKTVKVFRILDLPVSKYALAAVSLGILMMFFMEVMVPAIDSQKVNGPIANLQGAILRSENFRKAFTRPKEKRSLFAECKNIFTNQVDPNCVREKINKINF
jgi:hypothetical protein